MGEGCQSNINVPKSLNGVQEILIKFSPNEIKNVCNDKFVSNGVVPLWHLFGTSISKSFQSHPRYSYVRVKVKVKAIFRSLSVCAHRYASSLGFIKQCVSPGTTGPSAVNRDWIK